jgi:hypothetical protein
VRTGAVGEFLADISLYAGGNATWMNAALAAAKAGWRTEVHSLTPTDFKTEIQGYEAVNAQVDITDLRWVWPTSRSSRPITWPASRRSAAA